MQHPTVLRALTSTPRPDDIALEAFLDRYSGGTRENYATVLHILFEWCERRSIEPLAATRQQLEQFARYMENERRCAPSTVASHLSVVKGYYKFAFIDEWIARSPAEYLRMPMHFPDPARRTWLNRNEFGAVLHAAQESHVMEWALISMLGLLGLRISEALSVQIEDFQTIERGHRILRIVGKGKKAANIPLPVMVQRAMDAAAGSRESGQLLLRPINGEPMNRRSAAIAITRLVRSCGIETNITPHSFRRAYITNGLAAGVNVREMQKGARHSDPRLTMSYDRREDDYDSSANFTVASFIAAAA